MIQSVTVNNFVSIVTVKYETGMERVYKKGKSTKCCKTIY